MCTCLRLITSLACFVILLPYYAEGRALGFYDTDSGRNIEIPYPSTHQENKATTGQLIDSIKAVGEATKDLMSSQQQVGKTPKHTKSIVQNNDFISHGNKRSSSRRSKRSKRSTVVKVWSKYPRAAADTPESFLVMKHGKLTVMSKERLFQVARKSIHGFWSG